MVGVQADSSPILQELGTIVATDLTLPPAKPPAIEKLIPVFSRAQLETPPDKAKFVQLVNLILDSTGYRIQLPDGTLARLTVKPGGSGTGYIQFEPTKGGSRGGFMTTPCNFVFFARGGSASAIHE